MRFTRLFTQADPTRGFQDAAAEPQVRAAPPARSRRSIVAVLAAAALLGGAGCATTASGPRHDVEFDPQTITGDPALEKLNDEELFAAGSSAYAAGDFAQAARYFGRLADFHPRSRHRRAAVFNAGMAHEKLKEWEEANLRFSELADPRTGQGDALDAAFRMAETLYHLERYTDAADILELLASRDDLTGTRHMEAQVQLAVCLLEAGAAERSEKMLRKALDDYEARDARDEIDAYFPAQAHFFLGEIYRQHYTGVVLDPSKGADALSEELNYKAELLLSAQGHYLRSIRLGVAHWATASGQRIGGLYEDLYDHLSASPAPKELGPDEAAVYREELMKKIRVLVTKAIGVYEQTLEAAQRTGAQNAFVEQARASLEKMKELLVREDPAPKS